MNRIALLSSVVIGLLIAGTGCGSSASEPTVEGAPDQHGAARSADHEEVDSVTPGPGIYWCKGPTNQCIIDTSFSACSQACHAAGFGNCVFMQLPPC